MINIIYNKISNTEKLNMLLVECYNVGHKGVGAP